MNKDPDGVTVCAPWSPTVPIPTGQLFIVIFPGPVTSWTGSTPSDGSPKDSPWYEEKLQRRQPPGVKPAYEPDLFRARFCLLKRNDHLTPRDQRRLQRLFAVHPRLKVAWNALQELYGLYEANDLQGALEALDRFGDLYNSGQIPEYHDTVDTILNWIEEILAWHHDRRSNGPSKASTTSYKPSAEPHTGSPTHKTTPPEAYY